MPGAQIGRVVREFRNPAAAGTGLPQLPNERGTAEGEVSVGLAPGARLGPYEVVCAIGAGAMGEVYRARDDRLHREVALKVLPAEVASNVGRLARFEQEARAAAALNHPNILSIYDIGSDQGVTYIATELVIGETLAAVIKAGPVPLRRLLDIAVQVAAGLACAHASGIVHRDLKPENVMVTKEGAVKILDFGLAKQTVWSAAASVTGMGYRTDVGTILGTANYMSPEQARGQPADHRSDQFSLGIVLYEMAAGTLPFHKASTAETLSAIIADEPLPIDNRTPPPLRWTIDRCLAKDPNGRYESTHDLAAELRGLREHLSEASLTRPPAAGRPAHALRRRAPWYAGRGRPWNSGRCWRDVFRLRGHDRRISPSTATRRSPSSPEASSLRSGLRTDVRWPTPRDRFCSVRRRSSSAT